MSVPEIWLRFGYPAPRSAGERDVGEHVWQTILDVLCRYGLIDNEQLTGARQLAQLHLTWSDVGDYSAYSVVRRKGTTEVELQWNGQLMEEVTEAFCDDVACLAKEIAVAAPPEFALAGWEGWFTGADRPNVWEALESRRELEVISDTEVGLRHWFYLLGPERHVASRPYLAQVGARRIDPLPGGSVFLHLDYPADFDASRRSWEADMEFDPDYNPVARRNLEQPYQRRILSSLFPFLGSPTGQPSGPGG